MPTRSDTGTQLLTPEEYLARDRVAEAKSEYFAGEVQVMTGASRRHNLLVTNFARELSAALRGRPCETYTSDMRVKVADRSFVYPDVAVVCGEPELEDEQLDTLLNPTLLVEILSPSTEAHDRIRKWDLYRRLPSLRDFLLVSQEEPRVERYTRQSGGDWLYTVTERLDDELRLDSIGCTLALRDLYERVIDGEQHPIDHG